MCPSVVQNCCTRNDQLYIYHYMNDVFPGKIEEMKARVDSAFFSLERLHKKVVRAKADWTAFDVKKRDFCQMQFGLLSSYDFSLFSQTFKDIQEEWRASRTAYFRRFFCMLCDGQSQQYFSTRDATVTLSFKFCTGFLQANESRILFWLSDFMRYLKILQDVVDCNHYKDDFNLPFFDPVRAKEAEDGLACMNNLSESSAMTLCAGLCRDVGLGSFSKFVDGNVEFIEEAVNVFQAFNFNRENGRFIPLRVRQFYTRFELVEQLNATTADAFKELVRKTTMPSVLKLDMLGVIGDQTNIPNNQRLELMRDTPASPSGSRRLRQVASLKKSDFEGPEFGSGLFNYDRPTNRNAEFVSEVFADKFNAMFAKAGRDESLLANRRRLQGFDRLSDSRPAIRIDPSLQKTYDQIAAVSRLGLKSEFVFDIMDRVYDVDRIKRGLSVKDGVHMDYEAVELRMSKEAFRLLLFNRRPSDKFLQTIEEVVGQITEVEVLGMDRLLATDFAMSPETTYQDRVNGRRLRGSRSRKLQPDSRTV